MICKYFLTFCRLPFHFVESLFCYAEGFQFEVSLYLFAFVAYAFDVMPKNNHSQNQCQEAFSLVFS